MATDRCIVFTGLWPGGAAEETASFVSEGDLILCADDGFSICRAAGLVPDAVIGDFDSLDEERIAEIKNLGIKHIVLPREKDVTDTLECAKYGLARGFNRFLILGGIGGELGHTIANIQLLSFLADMECEAEIATREHRLFMADGVTIPACGRETKQARPVSFTGIPGTKFSVLSYAERSTGVVIANAKYELDGIIMTQSYPLGVNNEFINDRPVTVSVNYGRLLIIA